MSCRQVYESDVIERYVRGAGSRGEREAFERHYFECQACFEKLKAARLLRAELQPAAEGGQAPPRRRHFRTRTPVVALAATLAVAAAGVGLWLRGQRVPPSPEVPAAAEPGAVTPGIPGTAVAIAELARVDPPPYEAPRLRGPADEATRVFRDAMKKYAARDYAGAARGLERPPRLDPDAPDPPFYLGICRLVLGDTAAAARELRRAVDADGSAAADDARFYLAKAYLGLDDIEAARRELRVVAEGGREHAAEARSLLDALESIGARGR